MSLENTLREMLNEAYGSMVQQAAAKISKEGTPETRAHQETVRQRELLRGAIRRRIPSTKDARDVAVHQAEDLAKENPVPISRRERRAAARARKAREQSLKEHYKQRLEEGLLGNIGKAVSQMDLSPGSLARAAGRTASRIGNLVRGRGFKTGEDIAYERKEARAEAQRQVTPDAPKTPARSGFVASAKERKAERDADERDERRENIRRRMLKDPRTDEISAWGGA